MNRPETSGGRLLRGLRVHGLWLTAILAVGVFLGLSVFAGVDDLAAALRGFDPAAMAAVLVLTTIGYGFRFAKWEFYLRELDVDVGLRLSAVAFFSGLMMTITPGKAGEVWKAWFLREHAGSSVSEVTSVVGAERATDLIALSGMATLGLWLYGRSSAAIVAVVVVVVGGVLLLQWRTLCLGLLGYAESIPVVGDHADALERFYESAYALFGLRPLVVAVALSVAAWGLEGVALWLVLRGFGVEAGLVLGLFVFGLGSVVGAASMLPGGLGAAEASMLGLLVSMGYANAVASGATLVIRVGTLWYATVLGIVVFSAFKVAGDDADDRDRSR